MLFLVFLYFRMFPSCCSSACVFRLSSCGWLVLAWMSAGELLFYFAESPLTFISLHLLRDDDSKWQGLQSLFRRSPLLPPLPPRHFNPLPPVVSFCLPFFRSWTAPVQSELIVHWDRQRRKRCQSAGDRREPELGKNVHHRTAPLWSPLPLAFIFFFLKRTTFGWHFTTYFCSGCYWASPVSAWRFNFYLITLYPSQLNNVTSSIAVVWTVWFPIDTVWSNGEQILHNVSLWLHPKASPILSLSSWKGGCCQVEDVALFFFYYHLFHGYHEIDRYLTEILFLGEIFCRKHQLIQLYVCNFKHSCPFQSTQARSRSHLKKQQQQHSTSCFVAWQSDTNTKRPNYINAKPGHKN